jgi:hypothetical protein
MKKIDLTERFTDHFVLQEFLVSPTAERHGLPNIPLKCRIDLTKNRRQAFELEKK